MSLVCCTFSLLGGKEIHIHYSSFEVLNFLPQWHTPCGKKIKNRYILFFGFLEFLAVLLPSPLPNHLYGQCRSLWEGLNQCDNTPHWFFTFPTWKNIRLWDGTSEMQWPNKSFHLHKAAATTAFCIYAEIIFGVNKCVRVLKWHQSIEINTKSIKTPDLIVELNVNKIIK